MSRSEFQQKCDRLTQAVLFRRLSQADPKPQLYMCEIKERITDPNENYAWVVLSHDFPVDRMVICGGNAGFVNPSTFEGRSNGVRLPFRCERFISVASIDLELID